jgi:hypothetical protein
VGPGTIIGEKYRVERVIGRGGMGTVVEVIHAQLGTPFALKFLHHNVVGNAAMTERFFREARATAALKSEHVCRVFDMGSFEGVPYLVMERLDGTDLSKLLRRVRRLPPHDVCDYLIQACAGIAEAHAAQIVHRDLKPGNLFLTARPDGSPLIKVLDFGIAKAPQDTDNDLTGTNAVLGSPSYMSFEQLRSSKLVDTRSDIWSLGVILFELISGRRPFIGDGVADLAVKIALEPAPRLPDGPRELDDVIARCLAREPAQRYQSVAELAIALSPYATDAERSLALGLARAERTGRASDPAFDPGAPHSAQHAAVTYGPGTTMLSAGAIETAPRPMLPPRSLRARIGLISTVALAVIGGASIGIAVVSSGGGDGAAGTGGAVEPAKPAAPTAPAATPAAPAAVPGAPAATSDAAPAYEPTLPAGTEVAEPAGSDAVSKKPPVKPSTTPRKPAPAPLKPPQPPPPSNDDLGKSRI